jgi:hypothetical protein
MSATSTVSEQIGAGKRRRTIPQLVRAALTAGAAALIAIELYAVLIRAAGVPMRAGLPGAQAASPVTLGSFALGIVLATFWGTIIAALIARYAQRPRRAFQRVALLITAVSLATPLDAIGAATSTKVTLAGAHLLAAGIMIPVLGHGIPAVRSRS